MMRKDFISLFFLLSLLPVCPSASGQVSHSPASAANIVSTQISQPAPKPAPSVSAKDAYEKWKDEPDKTNIIDCRTPEEYVYVGHAPMAHNIPSEFMEHVWDENKKEYRMRDNPNFVGMVKSKFKLDDTIFVMCRAGGRSTLSVKRLIEAGFTNVVNIADGFEGALVNDSESYFAGKRLKNGWKNSGAPWTYGLKPRFVFKGD